MAAERHLGAQAHLSQARGGVVLQEHPGGAAVGKHVEQKRRVHGQLKLVERREAVPRGPQQTHVRDVELVRLRALGMEHVKGHLGAEIQPVAGRDAHAVQRLWLVEDDVLRCGAGRRLGRGLHHLGGGHRRRLGKLHPAHTGLGIGDAAALGFKNHLFPVLPDEPAHQAGAVLQIKGGVGLKFGGGGKNRGGRKGRQQEKGATGDGEKSLKA